MKSIMILLCAIACSVAQAQHKPFIFVFLNNNPGKEVLSKEKSDSIMTGHLNNIGRLAKEGKLQAAGPFENGGGIFVLNTASVKEANAWLATDPGIQANRWNVEVLPYTTPFGSVCAVGENYEMVLYQFVRFIPQPGITSKAIKQHKKFIQELIKTGSVLHHGSFGDTAGDILVLKADATTSLLEADPAVQSGSVKFEMKKLYIAKGSFCEK
jgi:uncharacterized protein YciI